MSNYTDVNNFGYCSDALYDKQSSKQVLTRKQVLIDPGRHADILVGGIGEAH
jgi:hypothetical protein